MVVLGGGAVSYERGTHEGLRAYGSEEITRGVLNGESVLCEKSFRLEPFWQ